jgi:hypothetical protein
MARRDRVRGKMGRSAYSPAEGSAVRWAMAENAPLRHGPVDVLSWFTEDELKRCPHCGKRSALAAESGPSVCLACEIVWVEAPG